MFVKVPNLYLESTETVSIQAISDENYWLWEHEKLRPFPKVLCWDVIKANKYFFPSLTSIVFKLYSLSFWPTSLSVVSLCTRTWRRPCRGSTWRRRSGFRWVWWRSTRHTAAPSSLHPASLKRNMQTRKELIYSHVFVCPFSTGVPATLSTLVPARLSADAAAGAGGKVRYVTLEKRNLPWIWRTIIHSIIKTFPTL